MNNDQVAQTLSKMVELTNQAYAEDGLYSFLTISYVKEFVDEERSCIVLNYFELDRNKQVVNWKYKTIQDIQKYWKELVERYEKDGGDEEYGGIENVMLTI